MSHSEVLPRLTVADTRREMIGWALGRASDMIDRDWNCGASHVCAIFGRNLRAPRMGSRVAHLLSATALICGLSLAAPAAAQVSVKPTVGNAYTLTADGGLGTGNGLAGGAVAVIVGLIGMALGGLALSRSRRTA
jgi:hypothetical protein